MSGVLINLLPDLRQQKLKEKHRRQLVTGASVATWVVCGVIVVGLVLTAGGQKVLISNTTKNIKEKQAQLEGTSGLLDALTAHQHLASLPALYDKRVYLTKFFTVYQETDPVNIVLSSLDVDANNLLTVHGSAPTYAEVAKLARALEASNVKVGSNAAESNAPYFTGVNIVTVDSGDRSGVSFTITSSLSGEVVSASSN
jgi:Tfp pilus assembly protein PilN